MTWIRVLGSFGAEVAGVPITLGGPRQRAVLALLVAARGRVVPVDRLIEDLWHGEPPAQAVTSLQAYVSNLRKLLEPDRAPRAPARLLVSAPPGYALRLPADAVDAWRFERLLQEAREASAPRATLEEALALWQGPAFAEAADEPWARAEISRLEELRLNARELQVAARLRSGDTAGAVPEAEQLTRDEPLHEEGWRLYALTLWAGGRQGDALAALRKARSLLADELGLDPGPALIELENAILGQRMDVLHASLGVPSPAPVPEQAPVDAPAAETDLFFGRDEELAALKATADQVQTGGLRVALVTGEAGLGKSALLARLAGELTREGWLVATGRSPETAGAPPAWAWAEALRTVAESVPPPPEAGVLLSDQPQAASDAAAGRFRLHRAVWTWLDTAARRRPLAIMLDDLHWADAETLALLTAAGTAPILLVGAFRADETGDRLTEALAVLARRSPLRLALTGLSGQAIARLVAAECSGPVDTGTVAALTERTGGNPFYVRESARLLSSEGALVATSEVPEGVRDVLRRRLARLPEPAVAVLRLAALAGRDVMVEALVEAAETGEDGVLDALDAGLIAGLLTEPEPGRVRFAHALVRDTMTADLSGLRRSRMHARLAAVLERLTPGDLPALAHHFTRAATSSTAAKAVDYSVRAAALAEDRYAHDTAATLLAQALESLERVPDQPDRDAARVGLLTELLRAQIRAGNVTAARDTRRRAVELAESARRDDLLLIAFTAWTELVPWQVRPYGAPVDEQILTPLSRLLKRTDLTPADRSLLLGAYAAELTGDGDPAARAAAEEGVALAAATGDPRLRALAVSTLIRELGQSDSAEHIRLSQELVDVSAEIDLSAGLWYGTFNLACAHALGNAPAAAHRLVHEALDLSRKYRLPEANFVGECAVAAWAHIEGRFGEAERLYTEATADMIRQGSLHAAGFLFLSRAAIAIDTGRLAELADQPYDAFGPVVADILAAALASAGRPDEARSMLGRSGPLRPDYFFTLFATFRSMAAVALGDREAAAELYELLLPHRGGPPAGIQSLSAALRPVDHTLGELARLLGRDEEAAEHFTEALKVAELWNSPQWTADARAALGS